MPKNKADATVHVATIGEGYDETVTWNSERAGRRINHADGKKKADTDIPKFKNFTYTEILDSYIGPLGSDTVHSLGRKILPPSSGCIKMKPIPLLLNRTGTAVNCLSFSSA